MLKIDNVFPYLSTSICVDFILDDAKFYGSSIDISLLPVAVVGL